MANDVSFLRATLNCLEAAGIQAWIFGGWAEELWGICPSWSHRDLDLLLLAQDFSALDRLLAIAPDLTEILAKRFSHKRAFLRENILVELLLAQGQGGQYHTDFFSGRFRFTWPPDTFDLEVLSTDQVIHVASPAALKSYREQHVRIEAAYAAYTPQK